MSYTESDEKILQNFLNIIGTENQGVKKQYDNFKSQEVSDGEAAKIIEQLA